MTHSCIHTVLICYINNITYIIRNAMPLLVYFTYSTLWYCYFYWNARSEYLSHLWIFDKVKNYFNGCCDCNMILSKRGMMFYASQISFQLTLKRTIKIMIFEICCGPSQANYIWRTGFVGQGISAIKRYFVKQFTGFKTTAACDLAIALGCIAILIILWLIVQP